MPLAEYQLVLAYLLHLMGLNTCFKYNSGKQSRNMEDLHLLLQTNDNIFLASGNSVLVSSAANISYLTRAFDWASSSFHINSRTDQRWRSSIVSYTSVQSDYYEICGYAGHYVHCQLYQLHDGSWRWLATQRKTSYRELTDIIYDAHDGYYFVAYTSSQGQSPVMELRSVKDQFSLPSTRNEPPLSSFHSDEANLEWWEKIIRTNNHNELQFTSTAEFRLHGIALAPGRRYLVFSEEAKELRSLETPWSRNHNKVVYPRIARICTGDPGLKLPNEEGLYFTSFFKTRLVCNLDYFVASGESEDSSSNSVRKLYFNYMLAMTQAYLSSTISHDDSTIYGLFSATDPAIPFLLNELGIRSPIALCSFRLSDINRVIHSSDLIKIRPPTLPTALSRYFNQTTSYFNASESVPANLWKFRCTNRVHRIRRTHSGGLETITDCPGPSSNKRRLAIETPMLADSVYPFGGQALALLSLPSHLTVMKEDPRFIERPLAHLCASCEPSTLGFDAVTVFYLGMASGEVFKLIVFMMSNAHLQPVRRNLHDRPALGSASRLKQSTVLHKLLLLPRRTEVTTIVLTHVDQDGRQTFLTPGVKMLLEPNSTLNLLLLNGKELLQTATHNCHEARSCKECMKLRDPECYWSVLENECNTNPDGLNGLATGEHSKCAEFDCKLEQYCAANSGSTCSTRSTLSADICNRTKARGSEVVAQLRMCNGSIRQGMLCSDRTQMKNSLGSPRLSENQEEPAASLTNMVWFLAIIICVATVLSATITWACVHHKCLFGNESLCRKKTVPSREGRVRCLHCERKNAKSLQMLERQTTLVTSSCPSSFHLSFESPVAHKEHPLETTHYLTLPYSKILPDSLSKADTMCLNNDLCGLVKKEVPNEILSPHHRLLCKDCNK